MRRQIVPQPIHGVKSILAIDPGLRVLGYAELLDGLIVEATCVKNPSPERDAVAWRDMARLVRAQWERNNGDTEPDLLILERMVLRKFGKARPDDIFQLVGVTGAVAAVFDCPHIIMKTPAEWNRGVNKQVNNRRIQARAANDDKERALEGVDSVVEMFENIPASIRHNAIDAAGLAYFAWDLWGDTDVA